MALWYNACTHSAAHAGGRPDDPAFRGQKLEPTDPQRTAAVGLDIFAKFVIPFEVVSVVLLAALVGAVVIARRD